MFVRNFTPHAVTVFNPMYIRETRSGDRFLDATIDRKSATLAHYPQESLILKVETTENMVLTQVNGCNFFNNDLGYFKFMPPDHVVENADVVIVSQKCAQLIKHQLQINQIPYFRAERFYFPHGIVHAEDPRVNPSAKIIGSLGLQRAIPLFSDLNYYASAIENNYMPSLPAVHAVCQSYVNLHPQQRQQLSFQGYEKMLDVLNNYIGVTRGSSPTYPTLNSNPTNNPFLAL